MKYHIIKRKCLVLLSLILPVSLCFGRTGEICIETKSGQMILTPMADNAVRVRIAG